MPKTMVGEYPDGASTEEEEMKIVKDYLTNNPAHSNAEIRQFLSRKKKTNYMTEFLADLPPMTQDAIINLYQQMMCPELAVDKEAMKEIGQMLNMLGGANMMRCAYYLFCWDTKAGGMIVGSQCRVIEHWWDGIGDWQA